MELLCRFRYPQPAVIPENEEWSALLGERLSGTLRRFVDEGLVAPPDLSTLVAHKYRVSDLKVLLQERGLPITGRKDDLIARLITADPGSMRRAVDGPPLLCCSDRGREITDQYLRAERKKREDMELKQTMLQQQVLAMLQEGEFEQASALIASDRGVESECYDSREDVDMLRLIFTARPKILAHLDESVLATVRVVAGMGHLWSPGWDPEMDCEHWLAPGLEAGLTMGNRKLRIWRVGAMLLDYVLARKEVERWRNDPHIAEGIEAVTIRNTNDDHTCEACRQLQNTRFRLNEAPELPYARCTSEQGCRCTLSPNLS